jgi:iron complex outermembrane recepter protein
VPMSKDQNSPLGYAQDVRKLSNVAMAVSSVLASMLAATAQAQHAPATTAPDADITEIVVTGSLLRRTDTENESPVTSFSAEQIKQTGLTTIADVVRSVSADNSGTLPTAFGIGFAAGASGVALRGLTVNSTLVLIDGRRAAPYALADDGQRSFVDLNTVPLDAVERIEVLKDGASSIYGADAIAGVVNVILKKQFRGAEVSAEVGKGQHPGGNTERFTASFGAGDLKTDRYNAYLNIEFQGDSRILAGDRPFPYNTTDLSSIGGKDQRFGAPGAFTGTTTPIMAPGEFTPGPGLTGLLNATQVGAFRPVGACGPGQGTSSAPSAVAGLTDTFCLQNRAPFGDDQPAQQRLGVSTRFTVQLNDATQAYTNASFYQNTVIVDGGPAQAQNAITINTDNLALPPTLASGALNPNDPFAAQGQYALLQYSFGDIQAQTIVKNHNFRWVTGIKGSAFGWDYDTGLVVNHTWLDFNQTGLINGNALFAAINNGTYNFISPSANTAAERAALAPALAKTSTSDLDSIDFKATRDLFQLPGGPLGVALGAEARYEAQADPSLNPNNEVEGLGNSQASGSRKVAATYFEFGIPVIKQLNIDIAGRYDHYSDFGSAFTPKAGFKFTPFKQLAIRGTYSKGFRAPSFSENGSSSAEGFITYTPSAGAPFPANFCATHSAGYCQTYNVAIESLANPNIKPEKSDSFTFGMIFEPIPQFSVSADAYAIKKTNVIEPPNVSPAVVAFLSGQPIPAGFTVTPDLPDPAFPNSPLRPVLATGFFANENSLRTDGLDLDFKGNVDFNGYGKWISDLSVTKIFSFKLIFPDGTSNQYVGTEAPYILSSGAGTPRYRGAWSNTYEYGPASATLSTYYTSGFAETGVDATGSPNACLYTTNYCHVASFIDMDLTAIYKVDDHMTASFTIENLLDRLPPLDPANYAGNNYNPTFAQAGIIGRFFKIGASYKF